MFILKPNFLDSLTFLLYFIAVWTHVVVGANFDDVLTPYMGPSGPAPVTNQNLPLPTYLEKSMKIKIFFSLISVRQIFLHRLKIIKFCYSNANPPSLL